MIAQRSEITRTLERGLDLLLAFGVGSSALTVPELAERTRMPLSTAYRLLQTLMTKGFVEPAGGGRYQLGASALALTSAARARFARGLGDLALPVMEELVNSTGETAILTIVSAMQAVCIESVESQQAIRLSFQRGRIMPLWAGASAKILLAYLDPAEQAAVVAQIGERRYANGEPIDARRLLRELEKIRTQGYVSTESEVDVGGRGVAVPVLSRRQSLIAGLSVAGPRERLHEQRIPGIVEELRRAAARISAQFELLR